MNIIAKITFIFTYPYLLKKLCIGGGVAIDLGRKIKVEETISCNGNSSRLTQGDWDQRILASALLRLGYKLSFLKYS